MRRFYHLLAVAIACLVFAASRGAFAQEGPAAPVMAPAAASASASASASAPVTAQATASAPPSAASAPAHAAPAAASVPAAAPSASHAVAATADIRVKDKVILTLRVPRAERSPQDRAKAANEALTL